MLPSLTTRIRIACARELDRLSCAGSYHRWSRRDVLTVRSDLGRQSVAPSSKNLDRGFLDHRHRALKDLGNRNGRHAAMVNRAVAQHAGRAIRRMANDLG